LFNFRLYFLRFVFHAIVWRLEVSEPELSRGIIPCFERSQPSSRRTTFRTSRPKLLPPPNCWIRQGFVRARDIRASHSSKRGANTRLPSRLLFHPFCCFQLSPRGSLRRSFSWPHVAFMSHGVTAAVCNPLKQEGNSCDIVRHGKGFQKSQKPLILLAIPAGFEPATHGVEIRYSLGENS
jgi:hypothetical protein